jgi:N-acetylneuraminic acid mutarotase
MRYGRGDPGVVEHKNKIHVISGFITNGIGYSSSQEIYDPETDTYEIRWGVPVPRSDMMVASINEKIYFIGGYRCVKDEYCGTLAWNHMYDPSMDTWITKTSIITPVSGAGVVVFSETIHIIGGYDYTNREEVKTVQIYDPVKDTWALGTPLPTGRSELGAVVLDGMIYAIGGNGKGDIYSNPTSNIVEMYDPSSDKWITQPVLPEPRAAMATVVRHGKIFVIGGTDNWAIKNVVDTTFIYDPVTAMWSESTPIPTARRSCEGDVVRDKIYVIGGVGEMGAGFSNEAYGFKPSVTNITSDDPDPSYISQLFMVSYSVTSTEGIPSGLVTTTIDGNDAQCIVPIVDGAGSCELNLNTAGIYTITARYSGDGFFVGSSDLESHLVIEPRVFLPLMMR